MSKPFKVWLIKRRGADELADGTKDTVYADICFYRRKDAKQYLEAKYGEYAKYYEVVGKS